MGLAEQTSSACVKKFLKKPSQNRKYVFSITNEYCADRHP